VLDNHLFHTFLTVCLPKQPSLEASSVCDTLRPDGGASWKIVLAVCPMIRGRRKNNADQAWKGKGPTPVIIGRYGDRYGRVKREVYFARQTSDGCRRQSTIPMLRSVSGNRCYTVILSKDPYPRVHRISPEALCSTTRTPTFEGSRTSVSLRATAPLGGQTRAGPPQTADT
jgi:hypothetical protein